MYWPTEREQAEISNELIDTYPQAPFNVLRAAFLMGCQEWEAEARRLVRLEEILWENEMEGIEMGCACTSGAVAPSVAHEYDLSVWDLADDDNDNAQQQILDSYHELWRRGRGYPAQEQ